jgi:aspartokinase
MRPTREANIPVRVKNSYNPTAPGTLITGQRDMSKALLTSIVCKRNVTMLDIVSTRMLGQYGFLAKLFQIFEELQISVDVVATSEVSVSITLDPAKMWSRELIKQVRAPRPTACRPLMLHRLAGRTLRVFCTVGRGGLSGLHLQLAPGQGGIRKTRTLVSGEHPLNLLLQRS